MRRVRAPASYWVASTRPLHLAVFLVPLIVFFEIGTNLWLSDAAHSTIQTIRAHSLLLDFFQEFGVVGRILPGVTILTVLLVWHVMLKDPWRVRPVVPFAMAAEALVWTVPLVVAVAIVRQVGGAVVPALAADAGQTLAALSTGGKVTISIGAGLYEELLFRMIGVTLLHALLVDLVRLPERWGTGLAVLISAAAFAAYHDVAAGGQIDLVKAACLFVAGAYFGVVYVIRGFGVVVGVHALYDVIVLLLLAGGR